MLLQVATVSANGDEKTAALIVEAMRMAGKDGVITVEESKTIDSSLESVEGMQLATGYISPYFVTDSDRQECVLEDCYILLTDLKLGSFAPLNPLFDAVYKKGKPLLVMAEDVEGEVIPVMVVNLRAGKMKSCAVKAYGVGAFRKELLNDIAALTGGRAVLQDLGATPENIKIEDLGRAERVLVTRTSTTLIRGRGDRNSVNQRVSSIRKQLETIDSSAHYERDRLQERLAKLVGGVSIIKVGADSDVAMQEKKARVEDAMFATRAAVEEGVVPGGGVALARLAEFLGFMAFKSDEGEGAMIVARAMKEPLRCIAHNAGQLSELVLKEVLEVDTFEWGYDALGGEGRHMINAGILDPTKVVRTALQNAASVAGIMLTCEVLVIDEPEEKPKARMPGRTAHA
jgi:chaperonin GroEL